MEFLFYAVLNFFQGLHRWFQRRSSTRQVIRVNLFRGSFDGLIDFLQFHTGGITLYFLGILANLLQACQRFVLFTRFGSIQRSFGRIIRQADEFYNVH